MNDQSRLRVLKAKVREQADDPNFIHHRWFVKYHLEIVEKIARELCEYYPQADVAKVVTLAWLHDYEKIVDFDNQYNTEMLATKALMQEVGYAAEQIIEMAGQINRYNAWADLSTAPIETQIVSSADAASHLVGPFMTLYWYENPGKTIEELQTEGQRKLAVDWEKKITLPEIRQAFEARRRFQLEVTGELPEAYLK